MHEIFLNCVFAIQLIIIIIVVIAAAAATATATATTTTTTIHIPYFTAVQLILKSAALTDQSLLIQCSAKNFLPILNVLSTTAICIRIYTAKSKSALSFRVICLV
jgi:hypothetical protein